MIINRSIEYVYSRTQSNPGNTRSPLFLRSVPGSEKGHDRIEISDDARQRYLDNSSSTLERAILKALPGLERFRSELRTIEMESDGMRRARLDEIKSRFQRETYVIDEEVLTHASKQLISYLGGK